MSSHSPEAKKGLAAALGRIPSGIFVLTARRGKEETGLLASWVQQCSFEPPLVTVAIKRGRFLGEWLLGGAAFTLNILDETQTDMIGHFGRGFEQGEPAFTDIDAEHRPAQAAILREALAHLDCRLVSRHPGGDHDILVCEVVHGAMLSDGRPMVHVRKSGMHY
jgi:flavin reductase (DIM6/NTAB) family NADH-FMN oxidoreductase RutF